MRLHPPIAIVLAVVLSASALLFAWPGSGARAGGDAAHGRALAGTRCAACHGADGAGGAPSVPRLAGQDADYLYRQLQAFGDGARASPVMDAVAAGLSERQRRDVAAFFAARSRHAAAGPEDALVDEGRVLFLAGGDDGRVPACADCHDAGKGGFAGGMRGMHGMAGMPMMGLPARHAPRLFGQHAAYVEQRLQGFTDGTPEALRMSAMAASMSLQQKRAVAAYVASRP
ncbi:MAG: cytochrome c4 [Xanthomonadaceae bacterium]|nr:cytochrome c4 [Xanthomonadaceae bacterium]MDE1963309.1 cytochrome c4 [Xanthomonadaceae bacterium]